MTDRQTIVRSADDTPIAVFISGTGPPLILVHGTSSDHTTFRVVGPMLATSWTVWAIDRRGRGASGDGAAYAIEREYEDLAAVASAAVSGEGSPGDVPIVGHSFGGRTALGAALRSDAISRLVVYEGAPSPPEVSYQEPDLEQDMHRLIALGRPDDALERFLRTVVGMGDADIAAYRANPVWPLRVAAAPTIVRELEAESTPAAGLEALSAVRQPVLQVLGGDSLPVFARATAALQDRLANGRVVVIDGARHAAHHTHPDRFVAEVNAFLRD